MEKGAKNVGTHEKVPLTGRSVLHQSPKHQRFFGKFGIRYKDYLFTKIVFSPILIGQKDLYFEIEKAQILTHK